MRTLAFMITSATSQSRMELDMRVYLVDVDAALTDSPVVTGVSTVWVVLMSWSTSMKRVQTDLNACGVLALPKPYTTGELLATLREVLDGAA